VKLPRAAGEVASGIFSITFRGEDETTSPPPTWRPPSGSFGKSWRGCFPSQRQPFGRHPRWPCGSSRSCAARAYSATGFQVSLPIHVFRFQPHWLGRPARFDYGRGPVRPPDSAGEGQAPIKTFTLRGIKESPPYLHDGRCLTLEDTVEFFNIVLGLGLVAFMLKL